LSNVRSTYVLPIKIKQFLPAIQAKEIKENGPGKQYAPRARFFDLQFFSDKIIAKGTINCNNKL
jgi:hypothetical protein